MAQPTRQFVDDLLAAWNAHDIARAAEFYAPDYEGTDVLRSSPYYGPEGIREMIARYLQAFPDLHFTTEDTIRDDSHIVLVWSAHGTHLGHIMNIPPTGRGVNLRGVSVLTVENGKVTRAMYMWDVAGLLRNIGLLPELA